MRVLEAVEVSLNWTDLDARTFHPRPKHKRTKGVRHVGAILKHIAVSTGMIPARELDLEEMPIVMALGVFVEEGLVGLYPKMAWQPKPLMKDEIEGSPDGHTTICDLLEENPKLSVALAFIKHLHADSLVTDEFKFTFYSCREKTIADKWMWTRQGMCYQSLLPEVQRSGLVRFHALHVCGNYSRPYTPVYQRSLVQFTEEELRQNWNMVKNHSEMVEVEK